MRTAMRLGLAPSLAAVMFCASPAAFGAGENIDPGNDDHQYAWGENAGWINAEPSGNGGPGVEVTDTGLAGWMWGENIGWISVTCANTGTCGTASYGVANDGYGKLTGFAWCENAGWINFSPTTCAPDPTCGVRIDPATGSFNGRAWGENIGWVTFSDGAPASWTARTSWCQSVVAPPGSAFTLTAAKSAGQTVVSWTALAGASWYDGVSGSLSTLRSTSGDFTASTQRCSASKTASLSFTDQSPNPPVGSGYWYVVRGANCRGRGTYDSGASSQHGSRDPGISASAAACP